MGIRPIRSSPGQEGRHPKGLTVTKLSLCLTSLVAAVPGAALAVYMVMVFRDFAGGPNVMFQALAGTALALGGIVALMPMGVLVFVRTPGSTKKKKEEPKAADDQAADTEAVAAVADDEEVAEGFEVSEGEAGEEMEVADDGGETMSFEEDAVAEVNEISDDESSAGASATDETLEVVDFMADGSDEVEITEDFLDDEDDAPKKNK